MTKIVPPRESIATRAPGRLDLMGGIADYSGSLVLQWPIQSAVHVAIQRHSRKTLRIASVPEARPTAVYWLAPARRAEFT